MGEKRYFISEASKLVGVESHVLRYWEEQLMLQIKRNEMGHRYYIEEDIILLRNIKKLMEKGIQLRGVKLVIPELKGKTEGDVLDLLEREAERQSREAYQQEEQGEDRRADSMIIKERVITEEGEVLTGTETAVGISGLGQARDMDNMQEVEPVHSREERMQQFQEIMSGLIGEAIRRSNAELACAVTDCVSDRVLKEMDYMMRVQEEQEEGRYKKLDETIRSLQKGKVRQEKKKKRFHKDS